MKHIHLSSVSSTNDHLRELMGQKTLSDFSCVSALEQTAAKGQRGNIWNSEPGKNIGLSVYKEGNGLALSNQFMISMATALALRELCATYFSDVAIKWPNDILVRGKKIAGILIETAVTGSQISWAIIGVGINVQQTVFQDLPHATSFAKEGKKDLNPAQLLTELLPILKKFLAQMTSQSYDELKQAYESELFGFQSPRVFKKPGLKPYIGVITGIDKQGALKVQNDSGLLEVFQLKEIAMQL